MSRLRIGCAGWSYRDWVGPVYDAGVPAGSWLSAYATAFPVVEIDSTFYALPAEKTVRGWIDRVRSVPGFGFAAKVWGEATHTHLARGSRARAIESATEFLDRVADPLDRAGRLEALLVQLPPGFSSDAEGRALSELGEVLSALEPRRRRVAVEFRNASWYAGAENRLVDDAERVLKDLGVSAARVDGLGSRFTPSRTAPWSYFRLHGRRTNIPPAERGQPHAPYNYLYSPTELHELAAPIRRTSEDDESTLVIFNNHYQGKAVHNASELGHAFGLPRVPLPLRPGAERRLDEFARG